MPAERVVVVPHGVEPALRGGEPGHGAVTAEADLRRRYALGDGPVLVYPAVTHPHKNHRFLLDLLRERWTDPDLRLVLIGGVGDAEAAVTGCADLRVCRLGRVPAADRNGLIAMAEALVFPSRYEGFGAPLIEAMALGTPVVAAATTAIPEVVGDAGLVLPLELDAWAGALVPRWRAGATSWSPPGGNGWPRTRPPASGAALAAAYRQRCRERPGAPRAPASREATGRRRRPPAADRRALPALRPRPRPDRRGDHPIVHELAALGHELHVVTAAALVPAPCRRAGLGGPPRAAETTPWGRSPGSTRSRPTSATSPARAAAFVGFSALAGLAALRGGRVDAVLAMSPPFTLGLTGWAVPPRAPRPARLQHPGRVPRRGHRDRCDHRPAGDRRRPLARASQLPPRRRRDRASRGHARQRRRQGRRAAGGRRRVIPNFVDTDAIRPQDRRTALRTELGIGDEPVVMYAGNVGFSQSLELVVDAARAIAGGDVS